MARALPAFDTDAAGGGRKRSPARRLRRKVAATSAAWFGCIPLADPTLKPAGLSPYPSAGGRTP